MSKRTTLVLIICACSSIASSIMLNALTGCAAARQEAKTIDNAAIILCDLFFAEQRPAMSVQDIEKAFCATATDIAPFLSSARVAVRAGGAARDLSRSQREREAQKP